MIVLNDLLWDGVYKIYQDDKLFKFSLDSILLSKFVTINKSCKNILDIGTGNAPIPMLLRRRCNSHIVGIEKQTEPYNLGLKSIEYNQLNDIELINLDVKEWYKSCLPNTFDTIVTNPPYKKINTGLQNLNKELLISRHEVTASLEDFIDISAFLLKDFGEFYMVNRPDRLVDILCIMRNKKIEPKKIRFVYPNKNKKTNLVLIKGVKNAKPFLQYEKNLYVYEENEEYSKEILEIYNKKECDKK